MIRFIKTPFSFPQLLTSATKQLNRDIHRVGVQRLMGNVMALWPRNKIQHSIKFNNVSSNKYFFSTNNQRKDAYQRQQQKSHQQKSGNLQKQGNNKTFVKFISRIRQYSHFLANNQSGSQSNILGASSIQKKMVEDINEHFKQADTNTKQISQSLSEISNKLEKMYRQSQSLYLKHKQSDDEKLRQKYETRFEQFVNLLKALDEKYYKQPQITKFQSIDAALFLLDMETELTSLIQLLYGAIRQESNPQFKFNRDIVNDNAFSKKFEHAWSKVKVIELDQSTKKNHDLVYSLLRKSVIMVTNAVVTQHTLTDWNNQYWHKILFGLSFPVSLVNLKKAELKCYKLWRKPKIQMVKHLLDLPQKGYIQHAKKIIYPSIKSNFFLYNHYAHSEKNNKQREPKQSGIKEATHNIFSKTENSGRILLLSHQNIRWRVQKPVQKLQKIRQLFNFNKQDNSRKEQKQIQTIIVHIHGGGFISMSSQLMQNHTRRWANELQVPVFSLDYRKPPYHRFPQPLQDCVAGYKFIVQRIHQYANIKPKNIIVAGDSAGGNMACALQAKLMKQKYPILPKALFLMYPAVDLRTRYTPSRLNSFSDGIFLPSLLMLCQEQYLGKDPKIQFNPLASPILLTESYINPQNKQKQESQKWPKNWPKTVIMAGRKDPLFDDSIRLLQRLTRDGIDSKMLLYKDFSHGFMSMDQALPGCKQAIADSISELKQIIRSF